MSSSRPLKRYLGRDTTSLLAAHIVLAAITR